MHFQNKVPLALSLVYYETYLFRLQFFPVEMTKQVVVVVAAVIAVVVAQNLLLLLLLLLLWL